jgi:hypothetical protein
LLHEFRGLMDAFLEGKWKVSALDAGRFCEVAYTVIEGALSSKFASTPAKPRNFLAACTALESKSPVLVGDRSLRILLPRVLPPVYEIRNNRNVGHVGGDVVSNKMDATYVVGSCSFVLAELIRVFHNCSTHEAQESVDALVERKVPLVWDFGGGKRVLDPKMSVADKVLVLLYLEPDWLAASDLFKWVKYGNTTRFRDKFLGNLDSALLIEFDAGADRCKITPLGIKDVEIRILKR